MAERCNCPAAGNREEPDYQHDCPVHGHLQPAFDPTAPSYAPGEFVDTRTYEDIWGERG